MFNICEICYRIVMFGNVHDSCTTAYIFGVWDGRDSLLKAVQGKKTLDDAIVALLRAHMQKVDYEERR